MKPDKIYIQEGAILRTENTYDNDVCYVRKDIVDDTIAIAEDHAYFAGKEKMREELLEWAKENHKMMVEVHSDYKKIYDEYFRGLIDKIKSL